MNETTGHVFVVRHLECKTLDGAFRIHIAPEALEQLDLKLGDLCQINDENGETKGHAIAWRATDRMGNSPKAKPAKMSETLKTAFGLKDGDQVTLVKASDQIVRADSLVLADVSPSDYGPATEKDDNRWKSRCAGVLANCEAVAPGTTFDVTGKNKHRRRFRVQFGSTEAMHSPVSTLYYCDDNTKLDISEQGSISTTSTRSPYLHLTSDRIGGLLYQIQTLNTQMQRVLKQTQESSLGPLGRPINEAVLLHGYEGTGKSLLLNRLEAVGFRKVLRLQKSTLIGGTVAKNQSIISSAFSDARANQPSLILLDDLHKLVPKGEDMYADVLSRELLNIKGTRILVVAACRSLSDVSSGLIAPGRFSLLIEFPIPDLEARTAILDALLSQHKLHAPVSPRWLGLRTHGFTGEDLVRLLDVAQRAALDRNDLDNEDRAADKSTLRERARLDDATTPTLGNGDVTDGLKDDRNAHTWSIDDKDWENALSKVRPTALREIFFEKPKVGWSDIGGSQGMKERFDEIIGWPLHHSELMKQYGITPEKGVLLYGPPGCSKTLTAQAVATTYDLNFIAVKGAELISMYVGESERAVREIFRKARAAAPCVIFFDEIDSIASERESGGTKGLNVLTTLLNEMDGFDALGGVLVLAATNKPEALDPAIMRPGRFDSHIYLGPPTEQARKEIFELSTRSQPLADDFDLEALVSETGGYTGAEIVQICLQAKKAAARRALASHGGLEKLSTADFRRAIEQTSRGVTEEMLSSYTAFSNRRSA